LVGIPSAGAHEAHLFLQRRGVADAVFERQYGPLARALAERHELGQQDELAADHVVIDVIALGRRNGRVGVEVRVVQRLARRDL